MASYEEIAAKLSPEYQKKLKRASEVTDDRQEMASIGLTDAMSGGLCYGGVTLIMGNYGSGKTALALQTAGMAQKEGKSVAMIDVEGSFKPEWGANLGLDVDNMLWLNIKDVGNVTDVMVQLMQAGTDIIIIDSISALGTANNVDLKTGEIKDFTESNQMGALSTQIGKMMTNANMANENTALILISQIRNNISTTGSYGFIPSGGKKMEHDPTSIIVLRSSHSDKERIKGTVKNGKRMIEKPIGNIVDWELKKHRGSGDGLTGVYNFYYDGDIRGIDSIDEIVSVGSKMGVINKGGAWFTLPNGEKFQGQPKTVEYLRSNPEEYELLKKEVLDAIS